MTLSDDFIVRSARIARRAVGGAAFFALASCTTADEPSGSNAHGGNGTGGENTGGNTDIGGASGSPASGSGGMSNSGGSEGGGAGVAVGGAGGAGGGAVATSPACAMGAATNTSGLAIKRPEIGARKLGNAAVPDVIRIDRDPKSGDLVYMNRGGKFWKVDPASGMSTPTEAGYTGGTDHRGMAFAPDGTLYTLSHNTNGGVIIRKGAPGATRAWSTLLTSAPYNPGNTTFDHWFAGVIVSPDNMSVYFSSGSRSDHGEVEADEREVPLTSAIFRVPASSNNLVSGERRNRAQALPICRRVTQFVRPRVELRGRAVRRRERSGHGSARRDQLDPRREELRVSVAFWQRGQPGPRSAVHAHWRYPPSYRLLCRRSEEMGLRRRDAAEARHAAHRSDL